MINNVNSFEQIRFSIEEINKPVNEDFTYIIIGNEKDLENYVPDKVEKIVLLASYRFVEKTVRNIIKSIRKMKRLTNI